MNVAYVAGPYWHPHPAVRQRRTELHAKAVAAILRSQDGLSATSDLVLFSPVVHGHNIDPHLHDSEQSERYWRRHGLAMLRRCDMIFVIKLDGWEQSTGTKAEIELAQSLNIPVEYFNPVEDLQIEAR